MEANQKLNLILNMLGVVLSNQVAVMEDNKQKFPYAIDMSKKIIDRTSGFLVNEIIKDMPGKGISGEAMQEMFEDTIKEDTIKEDK